MPLSDFHVAVGRSSGFPLSRPTMKCVRRFVARSGRTRAGRRGEIIYGRLPGRPICSWNVVDLPGFRAILFERAKVCHAAGVMHFQPIMKWTISPSGTAFPWASEM